MSIDLTPLENARKLLLSVGLEPVQGRRFQPTGFPDLGAATYQADDQQCLLVESAQSMANRLEAVCWDAATNELVPPLAGLSYIRVERDGKYLTSSITEAHRINSAYILDDSGFLDTLKKAIAAPDDAPIDRAAFSEGLLRYDANSLIHGVFLTKIAGRLRIARALSAFIEAVDVQVAASGGVKNDHINPKQAAGRAAAEGFGNVPFNREEYTAGTITAYFNLDLGQIRGYGLGGDVERLLILLALYKIRALLDGDLRLRTACDLAVVNGNGGITADRPEGFTLPPLAQLEDAVASAIAGCRERMAGTTTVNYTT